MTHALALPRLSAALAVAVLGAASVLLAGADWVGGAALALASGIAVALVAVGTGDGVARVQPDRVQSAGPADAGLLDALAEPVMVLAGGRVRLANGAAQALLGRHIVGQDARLAIRHPDAAVALGAAATGYHAIELEGVGRPDQHWQLRVGDAPGGQRLVQLVDRSGSYAAERMRVDFVANASHELRTPLASILGFIETLEGGAGADTATRQRFLRIMFGEAQRMQRLVADLLSLSRIESEKHRLPADTVDLARLIESVRAEVAAGDEASGRALTVAVASEVPAVTGDGPQLAQLLHNLVANALKYGRPGGRVTLALGRNGEGDVRLAVSDEGDGIAPEHLPRLTERFYRVDPGRSRSVGGTGLGLAIVKHIAERHRGRLEITSRAGTGSTFAVVLPPLARATLSQNGNADASRIEG